MAGKDVQLTINVDDDQFKQFVDDFNKIADMMKKMSDQWKKISASIDQTQSGGQGLLGRMGGMLQVSNKIHSTVGNITKHIFKWGALISGIGSLLGGGGLFGLNRMSESIIARQRFMQGIGGSNYAASLAAATITKSVLNDPASALSGIAIGQYAMGSPQWKALNLSGIGLTKEELGKTPEQMLPDILDKLPDYLQKNVKSKEQLELFAKPRGLTSIFGMEDLIRMREHPEEFHKKAKELREQAGLKPGAKELAIWEQFWTSVRTWHNTIDKEFIEKLAPLAGAMTHLTEAFTKLSVAIMQSSFLEGAIDKLAKNFEILADVLELKFRPALDTWTEILKSSGRNLMLGPAYWFLPPETKKKVDEFIFGGKKSDGTPVRPPDWSPGRDPFFGLPDTTAPTTPPAAPSAAPPAITYASGEDHRPGLFV
jgi:hypothetical protein